MRAMRSYLAAGALGLSLVATPVLADDRGMLVGFLEDNLSGAGRHVTISGFQGALSSRATMDELTVADDQGVWLTLKGVVLDWNRAAILGGRVSVNELSADEIIVERAPVSAESDAPAAEATGFSLPELPVSVQVGKIASPRIVLGEALVGEAVTASVSGALVLDGGEGRASLQLDRLDDAPKTEFDLMASFANSSRRLVVDLVAKEEAGGLIGKKIKLPGQPDFELSLKGDGIVDAFALRLKLATGGEERLAGQVTLMRPADAKGFNFAADVGGNVAPLFLPDYAEFFGNSTKLIAAGHLADDGAMDLTTLAVTTNALTVTGHLRLAADGLPEKFGLDATLVDASGEPVLLPIAGDNPTRLKSATVAVAFDQAVGPDWTARAVVNGLDRPDVAVGLVRLDATGRIENLPGGDQVTGGVSFLASGLQLADPAQAAAVGPSVTGSANVIWQETAGVVKISDLALNGAHYGLSGSGTIDDLDSGFRVAGQAEARLRDLSKFTAISGRPLAGSAAARISGGGSALGGDFDVKADVTGQDIVVGIAEADRLLRGTSQITVDAARGAAGTDIRSLTVVTTGLNASAEGRIATTGSELEANVSMPDLGVLGGSYRGAFNGNVTLNGTPDSGRVVVSAQGTNLAIGQAQADALLRGQSTVNLELGLRDGRIDVQLAQVVNPQLNVGATGTLTGDTQTVTVDARLANMAILMPDFPGALTVRGTVASDPRGVTLDLRGQGPGQIDARAQGTLAPDFSTGNVTLAGSAQSALANPFLGDRAVSGPVRFDLRLNGPLALKSVTGTVSMEGGRFTEPGQAIALENLSATARLAGSRADITARMRVDAGGSISAKGTVGLEAPFNGDLDITLERVVLRDPALYRTRANGQISITGPLTGGAMIAGRIALLETEIQVPSTGMGGSGAIPDPMEHLHEPAAVRATRERAGLIQTEAAAGGGSSRPFGLKLEISAPNQVFIRGRGLDAEVGGSLKLGGTTDAIVPTGGFDLIRGRLDILGKRLVLSKASVRLRGDFDVEFDIQATNSASGITSMVNLTGSASDPKVSFTSSPELPEEEVLSQLLFGRDLGSLSTLQTLRLASAVATLAGKGGTGLMGKLRSGTGLDDLDVQTNENGNTEVTAGKYLSDRTYSELSVDDQGLSEIHLNFELSDIVTLRARANSDGDTGIGVHLERDY